MLPRDFDVCGESVAVQLMLIFFSFFFFVKKFQDNVLHGAEIAQGGNISPDWSPLNSGTLAFPSRTVWRIFFSVAIISIKRKTKTELKETLVYVLLLAPYGLCILRNKFFSVVFWKGPPVVVDYLLTSR